VELKDNGAGMISMAAEPANTSQATTSTLLDEVVEKFVATTSAKATVPQQPPASEKKEVVKICPKPEENTDYKNMEDLRSEEEVESAEECQQRCTQVPDCGAWSWGSAEGMDGLTHRCFMKQLNDVGTFTKSDSFGITSGLPCNSAAVVRPRTVFPGQFPPHSLLCFALMQPVGYEPSLTRMQFNQGVGIFKCDEYALYSNQVIEVVPGVYTHQVDSDLKCQYGGEFMTALNTPIFFAVWDKVLEDGRYKLHEWTVKVDPDCVFFPSRLRIVLEAYDPASSETGMYINNCKFGMHGPLEIFSARAVETWTNGKQQCSDYFSSLCSGDCLWGEDMFIDQCLQRVFQVPRMDDWSILVEDHCDPPKGWESCEDRTKVAFHPYKTEETYLHCLRGAGALEEMASM